MSGAMESRAAVFTSQPQAVEVYQAGTWWAGELLGWRHGGDGSCEVQVRVTLGGVTETAWTDLTGLRLPERHLAVAPEPAAPADGSTTQELPRAASKRAQQASGVETAATASMPAVRDLSVVPTSPRPGGRRRAPENAEPTVAVASALTGGGRRRAPEQVEAAVALAAPRTGGRRRAPEEPAAADAGKHRAAPPADAGRHRRADTGLFPAVAEPATAAVPAARPPRPSRLDDTFGGRSRTAWSAVGEAEPELLTRPMRLSDHIPHARRPRLDGSLTGV